ncbi:MAG: DUF167 family protein [bacterium]|nr:DUF167 family protein [bacterium]
MPDHDRSSLDYLIRDHPCGVTLKVLVTPGASRNEVVGQHGTCIRVRVTARPEGGRANRAVAGLLSRLFGCRVDLPAGASSRFKRMLLRDANPDDVGRTISLLGHR